MNVSSSTPVLETTRRSKSPEVLERRSPFIISWFCWYVKRYLPKHFHAVRVSRTGPVPQDLPGPVIFLVNHPAWWDPLLCALLSTSFPQNKHFAPIDAAAFQQYGFFAKLGFYGVEQHSLRGAATFLRTSLALLEYADTMLWITAQGEFTDPRVRPTILRPGVGHLATRLSRGSIVPIALEYPFWQESKPEALIQFGEPILMPASEQCTANEWTERLAWRLEQTQDALAMLACQQRPEDFATILGGKTGVGGMFDYWRRFRAYLRGERFRADHAAVMETHRKEN